MVTKNESLRKRLLSEAKSAFKLTLYFGVWFSAITLLTHEILKLPGLPLQTWGLVWVKAGLCAKFMLVGQALFPMSQLLIGKVWRDVLPRSIFYLGVVLSLTVLETGLDGLLHGHEFFPSVFGFANGQPLYIFALAWVYWLILAPYLVINGILGHDEVNQRVNEQSFMLAEPDRSALALREIHGDYANPPTADAFLGASRFPTQ
jgi:hypothetical protein